MELLIMTEYGIEEVEAVFYNDSYFFDVAGYICFAHFDYDEYCVHEMKSGLLIGSDKTIETAIKNAWLNFGPEITAHNTNAYNIYQTTKTKAQWKNS